MVPSEARGEQGVSGGIGVGHGGLARSDEHLPRGDVVLTNQTRGLCENEPGARGASGAEIDTSELEATAATGSLRVRELEEQAAGREQRRRDERIGDPE
jgi:hypothetical protein